jgi:hypothetical protein
MRTEANRPSRRAGLAARSLFSLAALAMLPLALHAGDGVTGDGEPQLEPDSALAAALSVVSTGSISADIHFIASDQMRGRYTPSPELEIVARYLRARLQRLGFEPGEGEDFLFEYDLDHKALDPEHTVLKLTGVADPGTLAFGQEPLDGRITACGPPRPRICLRVANRVYSVERNSMPAKLTTDSESIFHCSYRRTSPRTPFTAFRNA